MMIRNMFEENINRQINGVIKVDQDTTEKALYELLQRLW